MTHYNNDYVQKVFEILAPLVGEIMAKGVIKSQIASIGADVETLRKDELPKLAEKVGRGLVVFLGSDKASKIAERIAQIG
jgi:hypothetical protein